MAKLVGLATVALLGQLALSDQAWGIDVGVKSMILIAFAAIAWREVKPSLKMLLARSEPVGHEVA